ncbi:MAG: hypothetical protein Q4G51_07155 [Dermatophilus congolensis]|nr:hypothetical protein [Dermatophilus congolensis]
MGSVDQSISAGLGGFFALFLLAAALWLLMRSLLKHLRNAEHHLFEEDIEAPEAVGAGVVHSRPSRTDRPDTGSPAEGAGRSDGAQGAHGAGTDSTV